MPDHRWSRVVVITLLVVSILGCGVAVEKGEAPSAAVVSDEGARRLDAYLARLSDWGFSGVILVARAGDVLLEKGYGYADREARRPVTPDTVFSVGSITKQFTAAAILNLESESRLSVEDPITKYFDGVPEDKSGITLHQLLTHSAGLPGAIGDDFEAIERDEYVRRALEAELEFEPGTGYDYSNVGYSLLGAIIEQLAEQSYEVYLHEVLFEPAGMPDTGYLLPAWDAERLAQGYLDGERWGTVVERPWADDGPYWHLRANGGIHSTVRDMYRWLDVVRAPGLLDQERHDKWLAPHVDEGDGDSHYAYGWVVHDTDWGRLIAHNGGNGVFGADFVYLPEDDLFVYVASNSSRHDSTNLREQILDALIGPAPPSPPAVSIYGGADPSVIARFSGTYAGEGGVLELGSDDVRLVATLRGQAILDQLMAHGPEQRERFQRLGDLVVGAVAGLAERREDAFDAMYDDTEAARERARRTLAFIERQEGRAGPLESIEYMGTIAPSGRYALPEEATAVSNVVARFANHALVFDMMWTDEDQYMGAAIGPLSDLPTVTLAPVDEKRFAGWIDGTASTTPLIEFTRADDAWCLTIEELRACRRSS
jgi:CubicO group peptidase (beta-lactamase class C family)